MRLVRFASFWVLAACTGKVQSGDADGDADTDSGSESDSTPEVCDPYCDHEVECDPAVVLEECLDNCACDVAVTIRPDLQAGYFDCMTSADCATPDRLDTCRETATEGAAPSDVANEFVQACEARAEECAIPCFVAILLTDEALEVLRACLEESTCDLVSACIGGTFSGLCV